MDNQSSRAVDPSQSFIDEVAWPSALGKRRREPSEVVQPVRSYIARMPTPRSGCDVPRRLVCDTIAHQSLNKAFNFEGLIAAHNTAVRSLAWSRSGTTMISGDTKGAIKYWESTMAPMKEILGTHQGQAVRGLDFAPSDAKFCSCADDGTVRIWDWELFQEERILAGHGWGVKSVRLAPVLPAHRVGLQDNQAIWDMDFHPVGHVLATASNDHRVKFWVRARPGDDVERDLDGAQKTLVQDRADSIGYVPPAVDEEQLALDNAPRGFNPGFETGGGRYGPDARFGGGGGRPGGGGFS
ncbi:hypothetical protein JL720_15978 [Aureococcus anophagefferens]|nr:hypothetical protein JL720_15978 [Aureococcus anophagefferens]